MQLNMKQAEIENQLWFGWSGYSASKKKSVALCPSVCKSITHPKLFVKQVFSPHFTFFIEKLLQYFFTSFQKPLCTGWLEREEVLQCASELTVVGWLSGQCVTLGCPGAQNREVSCSEEASNRQPGQNTGNAYFASTTALSLLSIELVKHLFTFLNAFLALLSCSPFFLSLLPLVEDWMGGGVCWHSCTVCFALDRALAHVHIPSLPSLPSLIPSLPPPR